MWGILKALLAAQILFHEKLDALISFDHDWTSRFNVIKLFSYSTQLSMEFIMLTNVKMPTIVGILRLIRIKMRYRRVLKQENIYFSLFFSLNEKLKFHAQLS